MNLSNCVPDPPPSPPNVLGISVNKMVVFAGDGVSLKSLPTLRTKCVPGEWALRDLLIGWRGFGGPQQ